MFSTALLASTLIDVTLAAVDPVDAYRGGMYGEEDSGMTRKIVLGALVVGVIWACLYAFDRFQKAKKVQAAKEAKSLFGELCSTHRVTPDERKKLELVAQRRKLEPPEAIFLDPESFDVVADKERDQSAWGSLRTKIYGDLALS